MKQGFAYSSINHFQDFVLHGIQILRVASRCAANDIVDLDVVVFASDAACERCKLLQSSNVNVMNQENYSPLSRLANSTVPDGICSNRKPVSSQLLPN